MPKTNAAWHARNVMPKHATADQRIAWHIAHAAHCACRPVPQGVLRLMVARGMPTSDYETTTDRPSSER